MTRNKRSMSWGGTILLIVSGGCAGAYHDYPCGCVPYGYSPPPPLAYTAYNAWPTPVAECFLTQNPSPETLPSEATPDAERYPSP